MFFTASINPNEEKNEQAKSASSSILDSLIEASKEIKNLLPGASLEIKLVNIKETKTLDFTYTSSKAITQSAAPQNFIGSDILKAKKEPPYFIEVNVNDHFYQKINYAVFGPDAFSERGLRAASFQMRYNDEIYTPDAFTQDDKEWKKSISRSKNKEERYNINSEFVFKSASSSGWEGSPTYNNETVTSSNLFNLDPGAFLSFKEIDIMLGRSFSWDDYNQVMVELDYEDDKGRKKSKKYTFTSEKDTTQTFKYRCLTEAPWTINYSILFFEVGGEIITQKGRENPPAIVISKPSKSEKDV